MPDKLNLKPEYILAKCCDPLPADKITGFLKSESGLFSVHKSDCLNLNSIQPDRLISLEWKDIIDEENEFKPDNRPLVDSIDDIDLAILRHHAEMGVDYAAVVAARTGIDRATVFERHKKLRDLKLLARVQPTMIQYRKRFTKKKWIKHRNHTYYELTALGRELADQGE